MTTQGESEGTFEETRRTPEGRMIVRRDLFLMLTVNRADQLAISREHAWNFVLVERNHKELRGGHYFPFVIPSTLFWCKESLLLQ
jgi:hypothetical protein